MGRIIHLSGLSPRLQDTIIRGTQPQEMTLKQLIKRTLSLDWAEQEAHWGAHSHVNAQADKYRQIRIR